jgi:hypothetical protein
MCASVPLHSLCCAPPLRPERGVSTLLCDHCDTDRMEAYREDSPENRTFVPLCMRQESSLSRLRDLCWLSRRQVLVRWPDVGRNASRVLAEALDSAGRIGAKVCEILRGNLDSAPAQLVQCLRLISHSLHRHGVGDEFVVDNGLLLVRRAISL